MELQYIVESFIKKHSEGSYWDFKQNWHIMRDRGRLYYTFWSIWNDDIRKILQMYVWAFERWCRLVTDEI